MTQFFILPACRTANVDIFIKCDCHRHLMKFILFNFAKRSRQLKDFVAL